MVKRTIKFLTSPQTTANQLSIEAAASRRARMHIESEVPSPTNQDNSPKRAYTDEWVASLFTPGWPRHQEYLELSDKSLGDIREVRGLGQLPDGQVPVITIAHNEMPRLPDFFRHYRKIGVKRFI